MTISTGELDLGVPASVSEARMGEMISGFEPIPQTLETANPVEFEYPEELSSRDRRPSRTVIKHCEIPCNMKPEIG